MSLRYDIRLPATAPHSLDQDEAWFSLVQRDGAEHRIRFHDYDRIFQHPGLYEQLYYERLKCDSPFVVADRLRAVLSNAKAPFHELRCLDLGAGNGMMGEELQKLGVARIIGADILHDARTAALRDRRGVYDAYHVEDFAAEDDSREARYAPWHLNALVSVAALGFGDIPPQAFFNALALIEPGGWVAFNIRETFFGQSDHTGFAQLIRDLLFGEVLTLHHVERYRHRISIDGRPLFYYAIVAQKWARSRDVRRSGAVA